ncbi:MAG: radical SAM protein [Acidimicrobiales bacterium]
MPFSIDIEVTNRCNAKCHFCPRDRTPHQGLMEREVFDRSLERAVEYASVCADLLDADCAISLCGLGEPLLNRHLADYVRQVRGAGFDVTVSSNGSLLDERRGRELLDAGLQQIYINVGEEGDDYEEVYQLPFQRTLENVVRFNEMAKGRCEVSVVLVDHRESPEHIARMRKYWTDQGIEHTLSYEIMNRGGSLFVDHMQYDHYSELAKAKAQLEGRVGTALCGAPFAFLFIGYDGQYYLCCSDWEKQAPMGSVFDTSFLGVTEAKLAHLASREPVCKTCNLDPVNKLTEELRAEAQGDAPPGSAAALLDALTEGNGVIQGIVEGLGHRVPEPGSSPVKRLIPVQAT